VILALESGCDASRVIRKFSDSSKVIDNVARQCPPSPPVSKLAEKVGAGFPPGNSASPAI
jgi:hypothetical protein